MILFSAFALVFLTFSSLATAAIYVPPVEQLVPSAEIVVVGTLSQGKDVDGQHRGQIIVKKVLYGKGLKPGSKIDVGWRPKPKKLPDGLAHTADYTFAPKTDGQHVFVLQSRRDKKKPFVLNWGTQYPERDEEKIQKLVAKGMDFDFVGKAEAAANAMAKKRGLASRIVARDGESFPVTADHRRDRLNFTIVKGKITKVSRG